MSRPTCESCRFFDDSEEPEPGRGDGFCSRFPPVAHIEPETEDRVSAWPPVSVDMWCGEHQPKERMR